MFTKQFFSKRGVIDYPYGISYEQFIDHLKVSIPIAKSDLDLKEKPLNTFIPPEIREDRGEFECEETPRLITQDDILCDLHCHTTASDGHMSIEELATIAISLGYHTIAVTDHSQSQGQANGLKPDSPCTVFTVSMIVAQPNSPAA